MNTTSPGKKTITERAALALMSIGILMVWQPWLHALFRWGFLVTLAGIVLFTVASHMSDLGVHKNSIKPE